MCGIIGTVINKKPLAQIRNIEVLYEEQQSRGNEGYGIANTTKMKRVRGKNLLDVLGWRNTNFIKSFKKNDALLFHHRKPTSTENTEKTAHPFFNENKTISLIHNGVIGNDKELYKKLKRKGHKFETEQYENRKKVFNDSEVILHQFEENLKKTNNDVKESLKQLLKQLRGSYAIAIGFKNEHKIYLLKIVSPCIISKSPEGNYFFSSELKGVYTYSNCGLKPKQKNADGFELVKKLEDGEFGVLTKNGYEKLGVLKKKEPKCETKNTFQKQIPSYYHNRTSYGIERDWSKKLRSFTHRLLLATDFSMYEDTYHLVDELELDLHDTMRMRMTFDNREKLRNYVLQWLKVNNSKALKKLSGKKSDLELLFYGSEQESKKMELSSKTMNN